MARDNLEHEVVSNEFQIVLERLCHIVETFINLCMFTRTRIRAVFTFYVILDPVHTMPADFENGTKYLRLGVGLTRYRQENI